MIRRMRHAAAVLAMACMMTVMMPAQMMTAFAANEQYQANDQAQSYLPDDLETSVHALLILLEHLDIIIRESQGSQPNRSHQHQYHIDIIQLGTQ